MTQIMQAAEAMTAVGVLRHAQLAGTDVAAALDEAKVWLASVVPFKDDADPEVVEMLRTPRPSQT